MITARAAKREDIDQFYPGETCSFRAWVAEVDGVPAGIVGISLSRPVATLFSAFNEELRPHLKSMTVLRLIKAAQQAAMETALPVFAIRSPDHPTAPAILARLGFEHYAVIGDDEVWRLP